MPKKSETREQAIQKAHMQVFAETKRMLEQAEKVKAARDKLFAIAGYIEAPKVTA